jgi:hypothetical protein
MQEQKMRLDMVEMMFTVAYQCYLETFDQLCGRAAPKAQFDKLESTLQSAWQHLMTRHAGLTRQLLDAGDAALARHAMAAQTELGSLCATKDQFRARCHLLDKVNSHATRLQGYRRIRTLSS